MLDPFDRRIRYLRISVTDRCNLRCDYCMPASGVDLIRREELLTFEEITEVVRCAVEIGFDKVRLTGGEPLVRRGIVDLVGLLAGVGGVRDLCMTTNGTLLAPLADPLGQAGLDRVRGRQAVSQALHGEAVEASAVIAIGKAAESMFHGAEEVLGDDMLAGLIITKQGHGDPRQWLNTRVRYIESSHPIPDQSSLDAGRAGRKGVPGRRARVHGAEVRPDTRTLADLRWQGCRAGGGGERAGGARGRGAGRGRAGGGAPQAGPDARCEDRP